MGGVELEYRKVCAFFAFVSPYRNGETCGPKSVLCGRLEITNKNLFCRIQHYQRLQREKRVGEVPTLSTVSLNFIKLSSCEFLQHIFFSDDGPKLVIYKWTE